MDFNEFTITGQFKRVLYETDHIIMASFLTLRPYTDRDTGKTRYYSNPLAISLPKKEGLALALDPDAFYKTRGYLSVDRKNGNWDRFFFNATRIYRVEPFGVEDTLENVNVLEGRVSGIFRDKNKTAVSLMVRDKNKDASFFKISFRGQLGERAAGLEKGDYVCAEAEAVYYSIESAGKKGIYFEGKNLTLLKPVTGPGGGKKESAEKKPGKKNNGKAGGYGYFDKANAAGVKKKL